MDVNQKKKKKKKKLNKNKTKHFSSKKRKNEKENGVQKKLRMYWLIAAKTTTSNQFPTKNAFPPNR